MSLVEPSLAYTRGFYYYLAAAQAMMIQMQSMISQSQSGMQQGMIYPGHPVMGYPGQLALGYAGQPSPNTVHPEPAMNSHSLEYPKRS